MDFIVTDRETIEHGIVVRSAYIVISIRDPDKRKPRIRQQAGLRGVLYVAFHDAEPCATMPLPDDIKLITPEQAKELIAFVQSWEGKVGTVVVHCEQGMSRSPAVAAALCKAYGGDESGFWREYQPNRFVYELMSRRPSG